MNATAVSLFSGAGGFCEGMRLGGWEVLCAVEHDPQAGQTYRANLRGVPLFHGDIADFLREAQPGVPNAQELGARSVGAVFGGPPCQGFSQIGPRRADDPRNLLYKEFIRVVMALKPWVFAMENVPRMVAMDGGRFRAEVLESFAGAGYRRTAVLAVRASDFGVPQHRHRIFFMGLRDGLPFAREFEEAVRHRMDGQKEDEPVTVHQALSDLPAEVSEDDGPLPYPGKPERACSRYQKLMRLDFDTALLPSAQKRAGLGSDMLHNHHTKGITARRRKIVESMRPGARGDSLPSDLWSGTRGHKWRRLDPERPSHTIMAQMHRDLSEWIHPVHDRWITVREAARLQSFHDGFVFKGSETQQLKQVGNAVPPLMALAVARTVEHILAQSESRAGR